jgi:hypothetical protein
MALRKEYLRAPRVVLDNDLLVNVAWIDVLELGGVTDVSVWLRKGVALGDLCESQCASEHGVRSPTNEASFGHLQPPLIKTKCWVLTDGRQVKASHAASCHDLAGDSFLASLSGRCKQSRSFKQFGIMHGQPCGVKLLSLSLLHRPLRLCNLVR